MYCIIDWHYIADTGDKDGPTRGFWEYVAPRFKDYPNVLYEVYNEPIDLGAQEWSSWKSRVQPWVDLIRSHAPQNLVLVGGPCWSQQIGGSATNSVSGGNIVYVGHIYPGIGASMWDNDGPITTAAQAHPVFITEWGYLEGAPNPCSGTQSGFGNPFKTYAENNGMSWIAWCADNSWDPKMFNSDWSLRTGENAMGGFVKDWLNQRRDSDIPAAATGTDPQTRIVPLPADAGPVRDRLFDLLGRQAVIVTGAVGCTRQAPALRTLTAESATNKW